MKNTKKLAAMIAALTLSACSIAPMFVMNASAEAVSLTLTKPADLSNAKINKDVYAYQVFTLDITPADEEKGTDKIINIDGWGSGVNPSTFLATIQNDATFNVEKDGSPVNVFAGIEYVSPETEGKTDNSFAQVGALLNDLTPEQQEAFAKAVIVNATAEGSTATQIEGEYANDAVSFTDIADGYYAISCKVEDKDDSNYYSTSLGMLTIVDGDATQVGANKDGEAKVGLPTVQKKVKENQASNYATVLATHETEDYSWNDVADYSIGEKVEFKLYGTMPSNIDEYKNYYYKFTDNLSTNFDKPIELDIMIDNKGDENDLTYKATYASGAWTVEGATGITVSNTTDGFTVEFTDIKTNQKADDSTLVTIEYKATLNENAVVGTPGQNNAVNLEYSNNPNKEGKGDTGTTPDDKVKVYTYAVKLNKDFFNAAGKQLTPDEVTSGVYNTAEFNLKDNDDTELYFLPSTDANYDYVLAKQGDKVEVEGEGGATAEVEATTTLTLTEVSGDLVIRIKGLDEGIYTLSETKAPNGYNKAPDQTIVITAETENDQTWDGTEEDETLSSFSWAAGDKTVYQGKDADGNDITTDEGSDTDTVIKQVNIDAIAKAKMENRQGTSLPSTGGIGTTIFYLGGGAMVAVAGVFLITKKRMGKQEN